EQDTNDSRDDLSPQLQRPRKYLAISEVSTTGSMSESFDRVLATGTVVHSNPGTITLMQSALLVSSSSVPQVHRDTRTDNIPELATRLLQT
ncbi:hypothetical protein IWQ62_005944, partial [Dispira parvispora]